MSLSIRSHSIISANLIERDGLLVMSRGTGIDSVLVNLVQHYIRLKVLVFVLNSDLFLSVCDLLEEMGVPRSAFPIQVTANMAAAERKRIYAKGGVVFPPTQTVLTDLLQGRLDPKLISGLIVMHAEKIAENSKEAFCIRTFKNQSGGFVKGLSEDVETLSSGFQKLEKILRLLHVDYVHMWPRFRDELQNDLSRRKVDVVELVQEPTQSVLQIQKNITLCMDFCVSELRRVAPVDLSDLDKENAMYESFDAQIRQRMLSMAAGATGKPRVRALLSELRVLRKLVGYVLRYDCVSFLSYIEALRLSSSMDDSKQSDWMTTQPGLQIFSLSRERVFQAISSTQQEVLELCMTPQAENWTGVPYTPSAHSLTTSGHYSYRPDVMWPIEVFVHPAFQTTVAPKFGVPSMPRPVAPSSTAKRTSSPVGSVEKEKGKKKLSGPALEGVPCVRLLIRLEPNPKWRNVQRVVSDARSAFVHVASSQRTNPERAVLPRSGGAAILILSRDERAASQLRSVLTGGQQELLRGGLWTSLSQTASRTLQTRNSVLACMGFHVSGLAWIRVNFASKNRRSAKERGSGALQDVGGDSSTPSSTSLIEYNKEWDPLDPGVPDWLVAACLLPPRERELVLAAELPTLDRSQWLRGLMAFGRFLRFGKDFYSNESKRAAAATFVDPGFPGAAATQQALLNPSAIQGPNSQQEPPFHSVGANGSQGNDKKALQAKNSSLGNFPILTPAAVASPELRLQWKALAVLVHNVRLHARQLDGAIFSEPAFEPDIDEKSVPSTESAPQLGSLDQPVDYSNSPARKTLDTSQEVRTIESPSCAARARAHAREQELDSLLTLQNAGSSEEQSDNPLGGDEDGTKKILSESEEIDAEEFVGEESALAEVGSKRVRDVEDTDSKVELVELLDSDDENGNGANLSTNINNVNKSGEDDEIEIISSTVSAMAPSEATLAMLAADEALRSSPLTKSKPKPKVKVSLLPRLQVTILTHQQVLSTPSLLTALRPSFVALTEPDPLLVRLLERYGASDASPTPLRVYILQLKNSAEQGRYVGAIRRENEAFERLAKARAVSAPEVSSVAAQIGRETLNAAFSASHSVGAASTSTSSAVLREGVPFMSPYGQHEHRQPQFSSFRNSTPVGADLSTSSGSNQEANTNSSLKGPYTGSVIVDTREFRSKLPSVLDGGGILVKSATLTVADYVLTPAAAIERKSVPDLTQSLASGRLVVQMEAMLRSYPLSFLLIELAEARGTSIRALGLEELPRAALSPAGLADVRARLVMLVLRFPRMRILWSASLHSTLDIFRLLKRGNPEPSLAEAVCVGTDRVPRRDEQGRVLEVDFDQLEKEEEERLRLEEEQLEKDIQDQNTLMSTETGVSKTGSSDGNADISVITSTELPGLKSYLAGKNVVAIDLLRKLPGITADNYRHVIHRVKSIADLARLNKQQLFDLIGSANGRLLFEFLHDHHTIDDS